MKKFFIAFLILAVTAANVFAEFTFSGRFWGTWDVLAGESGKERTFDENGEVSGVKEIYAPGEFTTKLGYSPNLIQSRLEVTAANEDNTWGGWLRIQESDPTPARAKVWWQPISQVKAILGFNDGFRPFGTFGGLDVHDYLGSKNYTVGDVLPDYSVDQGFTLLLAPIANLKVGVSVPIVAKDSKDKDQPAEVSYRRTAVWVGYTLEGIGTIGAGFKGSSADYTDGDDYKASQLANAESQINVGFDLTAIENLKAQIGFWYPIAQDTDGADVKDIKSQQNPITIALGADYTVPDTFGVRALISTKLGGKTTYDNGGDDDEIGLVFAFTLDPWVNIGIGNAGLSLTLRTTGPSKTGGVDGEDDRLELELTPYFSKTYGGGNFYAGFRLGFSNYFEDKTWDDESGKVTWAIPIGMCYNF
jgi:hypothetical protein